VAHFSQPRLLALHALKLKGFADAATLVASSGQAPSELEPILGELASEGLVSRREGRMQGWTLTPEGRIEHERLVLSDVDDSNRRSDIDDAYRRFMAINADLLDTCTAWQLKAAGDLRIINDHSDAEYDHEVRARLAAIHDTARPICADLAEAMDRFASYGPRLQLALDRVLSGQGDWFTRPVIDSYHTVWFELHEDLLSSLGIERSKEAAR